MIEVLEFGLKAVGALFVVAITGYILDAVLSEVRWYREALKRAQTAKYRLSERIRRWRY